MWIKSLLTITVLCLGLSISSSTFAQADNKSDNAHLWNLNNADIVTVIEAVSAETGKNFLLDPRVGGKISIVSTQPMGREEVYQVFLSMLQVLGFVAVPEASVIKIVPRSDAKGFSFPTNANPKGAEMMVQVIPVHQTSATKLIPVLRPMLPDNSYVVAYEPSNTLIVSGSASTLKHLTRVIKEIDHDDSSQVEIIPLHRADAVSALNLIATLQASNSDLKTGLSVAADEHSNSILLSGEKHARQRAKTLLNKLDANINSDSLHNTRVFALHYLKAKELAPILTKVAQGQEIDENGKTSGGNSKISIQAEPTTNSLIITAPPAMMTNLRAVIERLDDRPAQVLVEAAIVEVDESALKEIGITWGEFIRAGTALEPTDTFTSGNGLPSGFNPGIGLIKNGSIQGIVHILANDSAANILSTPSVMVMDNQQAKIEVGKTLSIETGQYASTNGNTSSVSPFNTFTRENIGLHLFVTPQINRGDSVQLIIDQGNQTLENPVNPTTTPVTNNTSLKTTVLVNNNDVLVLGGLISNNLLRNDTKIPVLGDLPAIGDFFTYRSKQMEKRNLMIFLKPHIIRKNASDISEDRYTYIRNEQINWESRQAHTFPAAQTRILPSLLNEAKLPVPFKEAS